MEMRMRLPKKTFACLGVALTLSVMIVENALAADSRGVQFIGLNDFSHFDRSIENGKTVFTSDEIVAKIPWNGLIVSWNAELSQDVQLNIEARAIYKKRATKFYSMGNWSGDAALHRRESVLNQKDADGDVSTDTLVLNEPCERLQLRLTLGGKAATESKLKFIGICLHDNRSKPKSLKPNHAAWGKTIPVIERSQGTYPNGGVLCSPTTVSMMMTYWSEQLKRPELDHDVPDIVKEVYDANWSGTGNWAFNMAYAGAYPGIRACVTRFSDVAELEDWIAAGIPVGVSLDYNRLREKDGAPSGHLVVCVGFTKDGSVIVNDPATMKNVRKTFLRKDLVAAWAHSHNAAYLIYPESEKLPDDRFGHWDSKRTRKMLRFDRTATKLDSWPAN